MGFRYVVRKLRINSLQPRRNYSIHKPVVTVKLDSPEFHSFFTPERKHLINIFEKYNQELRIVGGAVRDLLIRKQPIDVDFASVATPQQMKTIFKEENIHVLHNLVGENHGTVKVRVNDKENFQITTLRIDEATNGRFAKVQFTTDWYLDACRRDFTVNSLSMDRSGTVFDYLNGIEDLKNKKVKFIGDPEMRIKEDFLRILRYFRFYGRIATDPNNHDPEILQVIERNVNGLAGISGIILWKEIDKILSGNLKFNLMKTMLNINIASPIGLPREINTTEFDRLSKNSLEFPFDPITIIASLLKNEDELLAFNKRMQLRKGERELGIFVIKNRDEKSFEDPLKPFQKAMIFRKENQSEMRHRIEQVLNYRGDKELQTKFNDWQMPHFPIRNQHLLDRGINFGDKFNKIRKAMLEQWFKSSFTLTEKELLIKFNEIVNEIRENSKREKSKRRENFVS